MFSPRNRKMGRRWRPVQSSFFSTIRYRLRETQIPYNKIAEHLQDSEACLLSWWFMSCEPQKYVFLNQMVSPTAKGGGESGLTAASEHISSFKPATATWNHTLDPLEPHQNWTSAATQNHLHQNLQNHRNPHRTHIGTSGRTGTLRKLPEPVGNRHRKPPRPLSVLRPLS